MQRVLYLPMLAKQRHGGSARRPGGVSGVAQRRVIPQKFACARENLGSITFFTFRAKAMTEKVAVQLKNKVSRIYLIWGAVFIALFLAISAIGIFLGALNLDA